MSGVETKPLPPHCAQVLQRLMQDQQMKMEGVLMVAYQELGISPTEWTFDAMARQFVHSAPRPAQ